MGLIRETCYRCREPFGLDEGTYEVLRRSHGTFYCPHGHGQRYLEGESEETKLRREHDNLRQQAARLHDRIREEAERADKERRRANGYKGHAAKISKRAKAGVCPCCNRTFKQLARHMASKHPQFTPLEIDQVPEGTTVQ